MNERHRAARLGSKRILGLALAATTIGGCASGLTGMYSTSPGSGYGFEFMGDGIFYSHAGSDMGQGTYTVNGETVRICITYACKDLLVDGDCLEQDDGGRYCKE